MRLLRRASILRKANFRARCQTQAAQQSTTRGTDTSRRWTFTRSRSSRSGASGRCVLTPSRQTRWQAKCPRWVAAPTSMRLGLVRGARRRWSSCSLRLHPSRRGNKHRGLSKGSLRTSLDRPRWSLRATCSSSRARAARSATSSWGGHMRCPQLTDSTSEQSFNRLYLRANKALFSNGVRGFLPPPTASLSNEGRPCLSGLVIAPSFRG